MILGIQNVGFLYICWDVDAVCLLDLQCALYGFGNAAVIRVFDAILKMMFDY